MRGNRIRVKRRARRYRWAWWLVMLGLICYGLSLILPAPQSAEEAMPVARALSFDALSAYLIELSEHDSAESARIEAARYVKRGAAGYVLIESGRHKVIGARYLTAEQSQQVAERLSTSLGISATPIDLHSEPMRLRITAPPIQIAAFERAESRLRPLIDQLNELAMQLDEKQITIDEAQQALGAIHAESISLHDALMPLDHPAFAQLAHLLKALTEATSRQMFTQSETALFFSAKIKYNSITMRLEHIAFLEALAAN